MIVEIVVVLFFVLIGAWYIKMEHHTRKLKIIAIVAVGLLIYFSVSTIFMSDQVDLTSPRGIISAMYLYVGWLGQTASNLWNVAIETTHTVGNAIKVNNTEIDGRR
jgi:hypothetical protein